MQDYEKNYASFWKPLVEDPATGRLDPDKVMRELFDYHTAIQEVGKVYCHITNDRISKINSRAEAVIAIADECYALDFEGTDEEDCAIVLAEPITHDEVPANILRTWQLLTGAGFVPVEIEAGARSSESFIHIGIDPAGMVRQAKRLVTLMKTQGIEILDAEHEVEGGPQVEVTYHAGGDLALLTLYGVDDRLLPRRKPTGQLSACFVLPGAEKIDAIALNAESVIGIDYAKGDSYSVEAPVPHEQYGLDAAAANLHSKALSRAAETDEGVGYSVFGHGRLEGIRCLHCNLMVPIRTGCWVVRTGVGAGGALHSECGNTTLQTYKVGPRQSSPMTCPSKASAELERDSILKDDPDEDVVLEPGPAMLATKYYTIHEHEGY